MGNVFINGVQVSAGRSIIVNGDQVMVDGQNIDLKAYGRVVNIVVEGNVETVRNDNGDITVQGAVGDIKATNGDVIIKGDANHVNLVNGDAEVNGQVHGNVVAERGDIIMKKNRKF